MAWLLTAATIEGIRGVNNDGVPLELNFAEDAINSIFASNGVGKSSIFEALSFAIRGCIPKLDQLPTSEKGKRYYRNRFHTGAEGFVEIGLKETSGTAAGKIKVTLKNNGDRIIRSDDFDDPESILDSLDREFVFLDYQTFQDFISATDMKRGESFSGLLGLSKFSNVRRNLQSLSNTVAFNNTFETAVRAQKINQLEQIKGRNSVSVHQKMAELTGKKADEFDGVNEIADELVALLSTNPAIQSLCEGKELSEIDFEKCHLEIASAEGGENKKRYDSIIKEITELKKVESGPIDDSVFDGIAKSVGLLDAALKKTDGAAIFEVLASSKKVLEDHGWENKNLCPVCDEEASVSVLDHVNEKLKHFEEAEAAAIVLSKLIKDSGLLSPSLLDSKFREEGEPHLSDFFTDSDGKISISLEGLSQLKAQYKNLLERLEKKVEDLATKQTELEKSLPKSLVAVTHLVNTANIIRANIKDLFKADKELADVQLEHDKIEEFKMLIGSISEEFCKSEAHATSRRLNAVRPKAQELFKDILGPNVTPNFKKSEKTPNMKLYLESFWDQNDLSAVALLSESYRNALAISLYVAAAALYRGSASFIIFDDISSSFDGGNQFALAKTIQSKIARPQISDGLQFFFLSHDSLLEKLFIANHSKPGWKHQKIEGSPTLLVSPITTSMRAIKDQTIAYLNAGQVSSAAPGIRSFLEAKLLQIISKVKIPVPLDFAIEDKNKMLNNAVQSIDAAISLNDAANRLVLEPNQVTAFNTKSMSILSNFLSHYPTESTANLSASALLNVVNDIDSLSNCFRFEHPVNSGNYQYYKRLDKKF